VADTGILIDPIYTGKMLYGIYDLAAKGYFKPGSKILAVHSGGIWGLLGMKDRF
jgi:1-aminocyclopropane-1-carboxylate deaminase